MASEWRTVSLEDVSADVTVGYVGPMATEYVENGIPFLRSMNVEPLRINRNDLKFITPEFHARLSKSALQPGTVVIVRTGKPGACSVVPDWLPVANCSDLVIVRCGPELNPHFLAYYVNTAATGHVAAHLVGAVQQHFNVSSARTMKVLLPPIQEQRSISHILRTMDDKIELNRKTNETLEAMARALFKSWFVNFDPVRAKAEGRPTDLPDSIAAVLPDSFEGSELGETPKGWTTGAIDYYATLNPESWARGTYPEVVQYVDLSNTKWGRIESVARYEKATAPSRAQRVLRPGDTVIGTVRPGNGSYAMISEDGLTGSTGFAVLRPRQAEFREFIYLASTAHESIEALAHLADGGAYPAIRPEVVSAGRVIIPPPQIVEEFSKRTAPLLDQWAHLERQNSALALVRDALLPKLISGEIRLPAHEQATGEVG